LSLLLAAALAAWTVSVGVRGATMFEQEKQDTAADLQELPPGEGSRIVGAKCLACHGRELIVGQRLSRDAWGRELDKMTGWGAVLDAPERSVLLDYLSAHFGDPSLARTSMSPGGPGAEIAAKRCLTCHDANLIEQQRLTADGWAREVEKMVGWGASVTDSEKPLLIEHLAAPAAASTR